MSGCLFSRNFVGLLCPALKKEQNSCTKYTDLETTGNCNNYIFVTITEKI